MHQGALQQNPPAFSLPSFLWPRVQHKWWEEDMINKSRECGVKVECGQCVNRQLKMQAGATRSKEHAKKTNIKGHLAESKTNEGKMHREDGCR